MMLVAFLTHICKGLEWGADDVLRGPHHSLQGLLGCRGAVTIPDSNAVGRDAFYCPSVESFMIEGGDLAFFSLRMK